ncbi:hypothetical protein K2173_006433 [Erythroxylum novogranatense]|uniref:Small multi-drug export protein n=1 Tax=Erythroxylum novogranatense TaxID=1862640 RepID=A0AAV8U633_9ROSI|nr:hypothetical protein K2173_006433 [Erythroxylum novogranatense]
MAASMSPLSYSLSLKRSHLQIFPSQVNCGISFTVIKHHRRKSQPFWTFEAVKNSSRLLSLSRPLTETRAVSQLGFSGTTEEEEILPSFEEKPAKFLLWVVFWTSLSLTWFLASGDANAAIDSIKASSFGLRIANALRSFGLPDEAVVFALATLPVIELRGAIPVGYWMQLKPINLTIVAILGNMVPVPFIVLYLKKFASFLAGNNQAASRFLDMLFKRAKEKAGPVEEFQWLGLMLFVAVPFPGTGAWTGAFIASVLDMPFWSAVSANFVGVVLAGLLVNLLVNLGLKYAIITGIFLFVISTFMWTILRNVRSTFSSPNRGS